MHELEEEDEEEKLSDKDQVESFMWDSTIAFPVLATPFCTLLFLSVSLSPSVFIYD